MAGVNNVNSANSPYTAVFKKHEQQLLKIFSLGNDVANLNLNDGNSPLREQASKAVFGNTTKFAMPYMSEGIDNGLHVNPEEALQRLESRNSTAIGYLLAADITRTKHPDTYNNKGGSDRVEEMTRGIGGQVPTVARHGTDVGDIYTLSLNQNAIPIRTHLEQFAQEAIGKDAQADFIDNSKKFIDDPNQGAQVLDDLLNKTTTNEAALAPFQQQAAQDGTLATNETPTPSGDGSGSTAGSASTGNSTQNAGTTTQPANNTTGANSISINIDTTQQGIGG